AAMGVQNVSTMINTNWKTAQGIEGVDNVPFATCEIAVPQDFTIGEDGAPFILEVNGVEGQRQITASTEYGAVPQVLVTGKYYDEEARTSYFWRWPKERVRLNLAFPTVSDWMTDPTNLTFLAAGVESNLYDGYDPTVVDEQQQPTTDTPEGLVAVDLGLPSGTLWANMNVGAESPEDYGGYFAWGETTGKDVYNWDTYIHWNGTEYYCYNLGDDIAGTMYDAATANWDGEWCMPSIAQFQELLDNCETEWVTVNGVNGMKFTGTNGKYIFLPASGYRWNDGLNDADNYGYYRSSTPSWHPNSSDYLYFFSDNAYLDGQNGRLYGMAVRPVITPKKEETTTPDALEAVDLGLPSGTKWANMNVGANAPEEYGSYFAWGETKEKDVYDWSTYIHCDGSSSTCHDLGSDIAGTEYDAATANWGSDWQMPTKDQITELLDNTTSTWTTQNGVYGRLFTASNGNSIFLPAAGLRWGGDLDSVGSYSCYWSSAQNPSNSDSAYDLYFGSDNAGWFDDYRYFGQSVRPVLRN
ncbi:MAG: hypothetical protein IKH26_02780, partial [Bacteroidaceae bacterium]|nr:hypothetical protein [Bacteroidaceae bacterium]